MNMSQDPQLCGADTTELPISGWNPDPGNMSQDPQLCGVDTPELPSSG